MNTMRILGDNHLLFRLQYVDRSWLSRFVLACDEVPRVAVLLRPGLIVMTWSPDFDRVLWTLGGDIGSAAMGQVRVLSLGRWSLGSSSGGYNGVCRCDNGSNSVEELGFLLRE